MKRHYKDNNFKNMIFIDISKQNILIVNIILKNDFYVFIIYLEINNYFIINMFD